ncbi:KilA-N domain-containing protein [uncultured Roseivirga sp.]|uniref:KilA-N domain-containing protein n=1 Tax=uncultured Roseivirga sp. TaxID=543088 RepID=UPI0030DB4701
MKKIEVEGKVITIVDHNSDDFISLTDMIKAKDGSFYISDWLRNANTLDYISAWESMHNPNFNYGEFATIRQSAGSNAFKVSVKELIEKTNATCVIAKAGRYGGTYAHKDIAFNFGMWISPVFQLYIVKEYQRLKEVETNQYNLEWNVKRVLSKVNYTIQTDAVKDYILPQSNFTKETEWLAYAEEADILNVALFGCTAKQWREVNAQLTLEGKNLRDIASINELAILSNLESANADMIREGMSKKERFEKLYKIARYQKEILDKQDFLKSLKKTSDDIYLDSANSNELPE